MSIIYISDNYLKSSRLRSTNCLYKSRWILQYEAILETGSRYCSHQYTCAIAVSLGIYACAVIFVCLSKSDATINSTKRAVDELILPSIFIRCNDSRYKFTIHAMGHFMRVFVIHERKCHGGREQRLVDYLRYTALLHHTFTYTLLPLPLTFNDLKCPLHRSRKPYSSCK